MLILLDQSLADDFENLDPEDVNHFEDLLFFHSRFYHYVATTKRTALDLIKKSDGKLSGRAVNTLKLISTQSLDLAGIRKSVNFHVIVKRSQLAGVIKQEQDHQIQWVCDLQFASKWFSQSTTLIAENLTDTKVIRAAAIDFGGEHRIDHRMNKFSPEMSGGSGNAPAVLENRLTLGSCPAICVIDSDKLSKNSNPSISVEKCQAISKEIGGINHFMALDERELENLLPTGLLEGAVSRLPISAARDQIQENLDQLKSLRTAFPEVYSYVDVKLGTCVTWAKKHNVSDSFKVAPVIAKCECNKDCDGCIAPPLFKEVLDKTADFVTNENPKKLQSILQPESRENWLKLGQAILSFSLSNYIRAT
jgi:hypothetical protein